MIKATKSAAKPAGTTVKKATASKAAPASKPPVAKSAGAAKAAPKKKVATAKRPPVPEDQRRHYVEVAAYYIAERRGFAEGDPLGDWAAAEAEIDRLLAEGLLNP